MTIPASLQMVPRPVGSVSYFPSVIPVQDTPPASSALVWFDSSVTPAVLKAWDGAAWVAAAGGTGSDPTRVAKAGDTMTGNLTVNDAKVSAGTTTDVLGSALEVIRNAIVTGRIDQNANGMRVQALTGTLQLRGTGNTGIAIDSAGVADFANAPTIAGVGLAETIDDRVATLLVQGTGITLTYNDAANTLTVAASGGAAYAAPPRRPKISSYVAPRGLTASAAGAAAFGSGAVPALEFEIPQAMTIDQLGFRVTTLEAAMNAKVLLYSSDADGYPTTLVKDSGAISCAAAGDILATFTGVALAAGTYWAVIRSNAGSAVRFLCGVQAPRSPISTGTTNLWNTVNYLTIDPGTYASPNATISTWTDTTTTGSNNVMPVIFMRRSA